MIENLKDILEKLGYAPIQETKGFRVAAVYRGGDNPTSVLVYFDGGFHDFVTNTRGSFLDFVRLTNGFKTNVESKKFLEEKFGTSYDVFGSMVTPQDSSQANVETTARRRKRVDQACDINNLDLDYTYFIRRGISADVLRQFRSGVCHDGKMKNRYVIPIFDTVDSNKLVGVTGRTLAGSTTKYLHLGQKTEWVFPWNLGSESICSKGEVILVESPADVLSLYECGVKNVICLFGLNVSLAIINILLSNRIKKIYVATNRDLESNRGQDAALAIRNRLSKYWNRSNIKITLPPYPYKDFNEVLCSANGRQKVTNFFNFNESKSVIINDTNN